MKRTRIALVLVGVLALVGGGTALASKSKPKRSTTSRAFVADARGTREGHGDELAAAATYLGTTTDSLLTQLQAGKTLAQIAAATSGKSASGLIDALVAQEKTEIASAVAAGRLTQAQADRISEDLQQRVAGLVNGMFRPHRMHGPGDELAAAASYLGTTTASLLTQLQSGKTLAQIADATSGKSASGLIDALVTHEKTEIASAVSAGKLTQAQADQLTANLQQHVTDLVDGVHAPRPPRWGGGPPGDGPPPGAPFGFGPGSPGPTAGSSTF